MIASALIAVALCFAASCKPVWQQDPGNAAYERGQEAHNRGDYEEAALLFRLAAEQGHTRAQRNVGHAYELGLGVTTNKVESAKWYRLAAEQGDPFAQFALGSMYAKGEGVPRNDLLAYKWWNLAAAYGYGHPANITTLEGRMTPDQIAEAQKLSAEWKPLSER